MKKIWIFILLLHLFACKEREREVSFVGFSENDSMLVFEPQIAEIKNDTILAKASLKAAKKSGKVWLKVLLQNRGKAVLKADPFQMQISNSQGVRSQIVEVGNSDSARALQQGEFVEYQVAFQPVNSFNLYRLAQLKGDLSQKYQIPLEFVTNEGVSLNVTPLSFWLNDSTYRNYLNVYGNDKYLKVYQLGEDLSVFQSELLTYLNKNLPLLVPDEGMKSPNASPKQHNMSINEQEIMINGMVVKMLCYSDKEKTNLNLQLINHGDYPIALNTKEIEILKENHKISPINISEERFKAYKKTPDNQMIAILRSERFQYVFEFEGVFQEKNTISLNGLKIGEKMIPVFNKPLKMKRVEF